MTMRKHNICMCCGFTFAAICFLGVALIDNNNLLGWVGFVIDILIAVYFGYRASKFQKGI